MARPGPRAPRRPPPSRTPGDGEPTATGWHTRRGQEQSRRWLPWCCQRPAMVVVNGPVSCGSRCHGGRCTFDRPRASGTDVRDAMVASDAGEDDPTVRHVAACDDHAMRAHDTRLPNPRRPFRFDVIWPRSSSAVCTSARRRSARVEHPFSTVDEGWLTDQTRPVRTAQTAACVRSRTDSFRRTFCTCSLTVSTLIARASAISSLDSP